MAADFVTRTRIGLLGVIAALVLSSTAAAAPNEPRQEVVATDQSWAASIVLEPSDMGGSWAASPSEDPGPVTSTAGCDAFRPDRSDLTFTGNVLSDDFARPDGAVVSSMATIWQSEAQAQADWDRSLQPEFFRCIAASLRMNTGTLKIAVTVEGALAFPTLAARTAAYRIGFTVTKTVKVKRKSRRVSVKGWFDLVYVGQGRATAALAFVSFARKPITPGYEQSLARLVASRMAIDPAAAPSPTPTPTP